MRAVILLYCIAVVMFILGLSLRWKFLEGSRRRKARKPLAPVVNIEVGRRSRAKVHKHA